MTTKRVRAPKGYYFQITPTKDVPCTCAECSKFKKKHDATPYSVRINLMDSKTDKYCGHVNLVKQRTGYYKTHSSLNEMLRGKGIGAIMYAKAIQYCHDNGYKVSSSGNSSGDAQRVWAGKKIRAYFQVRKRSTNYGSPIWFAYSKVA